MVATDDYIQTLEDYDISGLTDIQEKILSLLPLIPGTLSIIGSLMIIRVVRIQNRKRRHGNSSSSNRNSNSNSNNIPKILNLPSSPYQRIMVAMSCCDIIMTVGLMSRVFLMPHDTSQWIWSIGNDTTCLISGTIHQFGLSQMWYNGFLSYYFLATVRYGVRPQKMVRYEPFVHGFIILWSLSTAFSGLILGFYSPVSIGPGCWVNDYPRGCSDEEGQEPCKSGDIAWLIGGLPNFLIFISITVCNLLIYGFVRKTVMKSVSRASQNITSESSNVIMASQLKRVRAVATQSFLYVAAYLLSFAWESTLRILESLRFSAGNTSVLLPLYIILQIFTPLQGFNNFFIFIRPQYMACRKDFPNESKLWCLKRVVWNERMEPTNTSTISGSNPLQLHAPAFQNKEGTHEDHSTQQQQQENETKHNDVSPPISSRPSAVVDSGISVNTADSSGDVGVEKDCENPPFVSSTSDDIEMNDSNIEEEKVELEEHQSKKKQERKKEKQESFVRRLSKRLSRKQLSAYQVDNDGRPNQQQDAARGEEMVRQLSQRIDQAIDLFPGSETQAMSSHF